MIKPYTEKELEELIREYWVEYRLKRKIKEDKPSGNKYIEYTEDSGKQKYWNSLFEEE